VGGLLGLPPQEISRLAVQGLAERFEGGEPDRLGSPVLEHGQVRGGDADEVRQCATAIFRRASTRSMSTMIGT